MDGQECKNCRFWHDAQEIDNESACRRFPPTLNQVYLAEEVRARNSQEEAVELAMSATAWFWPVTPSNGWCGEWQAIPLPVIATPASSHPPRS